MNALGARVRLVKGAYQEPKSVAYQRKADVDASFVRDHAGAARRAGTYPAIATHDPDMIAATRAFAVSNATSPPIGIEFQMLYGIRRDLQGSLREARVSASAYMSHSAANGSPTSCAGWANARPISVS